MKKRWTSLCLAGLLCSVLPGPIPATAQDGAITIDSVVPDGAAARAGLESGDRLQRIAGRDLAGMEDLEAALAGKKPGDEVAVTVGRGGEEHELLLVLGQHPQDPQKPLLGVSLAISRGRPIPDRPVGPAERSLALRQLADHLAEGYLYPEKGEQLAVRLRQAEHSDRFADAGRLPAFIAAVNEYLLEISDDRHLRLGFSGDGRSHQGGERRVVRRAAPAAGGHADGGHPAGGERVRRLPEGDGDEHHGFAGAEILDGNVGYIDLRGFAGESARAEADEVMTRLAGTDALILDLRQNGGGGPFMVRYLSGFLFAEPTHLASTFMRGWDAPRERWSLHDGRPTEAFVDKPVYVLTSRRTFSAAESFTFGLKINGRITTVGERTGGGGHFGRTIELDNGLRFFLPHGRTYDPKTGKGWEAEGIAPDVEVPAAEALEVALREARKRG